MHRSPEKPRSGGGDLSETGKQAAQETRVTRPSHTPPNEQRSSYSAPWDRTQLLCSHDMFPADIRAEGQLALVCSRLEHPSRWGPSLSSLGSLVLLEREGLASLSSRAPSNPKTLGIQEIPI